MLGSLSSSSSCASLNSFTMETREMPLKVYSHLKELVPVSLSTEVKGGNTEETSMIVQYKKAWVWFMAVGGQFGPIVSVQSGTVQKITGLNNYTVQASSQDLCSLLSYWHD